MSVKLSANKNLFFTIFGYSLLLLIAITVVSKLMQVISDALTSVLSTETESGAIFSLFVFAVLLLGFLVVIGWIYSSIENSIWSLIMNKKKEKTFKFFLLNVIMIPIIAVILFILSWILLTAIAIPIVSPVLFFVLAFICGYLLYYSYAAFAVERKIKKTLKLTFTKSFGQLKHLFVFLIVAGILAFFLDIGSYFLGSAHPWISYSFDFAVLSAYSAWFQIVLGNALKSAKL